MTTHSAMLLEVDVRGLGWDDMTTSGSPSGSLGATPMAPPPHPGPPEAEVTRGRQNYLEFMAHLHHAFQPSLYVEIGVRRGRSLALASASAVGIDPDMDLSQPPGSHIDLYSTTSDAFFASPSAEAVSGISHTMAFIDGMHLIEYVVRDFENLEQRLGPASLVVIDDIFPNHPLQAKRHRQTQVWTGDVWKIRPILRDHRPDLTVMAVDTWPSGLLLVAGLDPTGAADQPLRLDSVTENGDPPDDVLHRSEGLHPQDPKIDRLLATLRSLGNAASYADVQRALAAMGT